MDSISPSFQTKKDNILSDLSLPDEEYSDLSPKGSVDRKIRPLIRDINGLPGLVTTSSCSGRISVFLEGQGRRKGDVDHTGLVSPPQRTETEGSDGRYQVEQSQHNFAPAGGKGTGKWLFVSHDPVVIGENEKGISRAGKTSYETFGLSPGDGTINARNTEQLRLVRFLFEPMILHVMCASLDYAQPVLAAASSSGLRESGLQSLRCLTDPSAHPIVAVRSAGLSLESIIGYYSHQHGCARASVSEDYLQVLIALGNERFKVNSERIERFRAKLMEMCTRPSRIGSARREGWEDADVRRERKRAEGLARKEALRKDTSKLEYDEDDESQTDLTFGCLEG